MQNTMVMGGRVYYDRSGQKLDKGGNMKMADTSKLHLVLSPLVGMAERIFDYSEEYNLTANHNIMNLWSITTSPQFLICQTN